MKHFKHAKSSRSVTRSALSVLLKRKPRSGAGRGADVYIWVKKNPACGCTSRGSAPRFTHTADLTSEATFLCEGICRGVDSGKEVLYSALVKVSRLRNITRI